jgi:arabinan endo-1,5-alpha-L-arabinosidase
MAKEGDTYYLFCTGFGISVWSSKDLKNWRKESPVFSKAPTWAVDTIPGFKGPHLGTGHYQSKRAVVPVLLRYQAFRKKYIGYWRCHQ